MKLYTGGAVDYADLDRTHIWRHALQRALPEWEVYCPICAAAQLEAGLPAEVMDIGIMTSNLGALHHADRAVFLLDGTFTVGTPVEIHHKFKQDPRRVCIIHGAPPGLFVRRWAAKGVTVVPDLEAAIAWLLRDAAPVVLQ